MMRQYLRVKEEYSDCILFFRMGDFYEMFLEDAREAAAVLDIALTKRQNELPMCGVPYHAADAYIARLLKSGRKIAICEQSSDGPAGSKLMERKVVRVITPGTVVEENLLAGQGANYICALYFDDRQYHLSFGGPTRVRETGGSLVDRARPAKGGPEVETYPRPWLALLDFSTGDFLLTSPPSEDAENGNRAEDHRQWLMSALTRFQPREVLVAEGQRAALEELDRGEDLYISPVADYLTSREQGARRLKREWGLGDNSLSAFQLAEKSPWLAAINLLFGYLDTTSHVESLSFIRPPRVLSEGNVMDLDDQTIRHLDLVHNFFENSRRRTLFTVLNRTKTAPGRRLLEHRILHPSRDTGEIAGRLERTRYFFEREEDREKITGLLAECADLDRLLSRLRMKKGQPRDFAALVRTWLAWEKIREGLPETLLASGGEVDGENDWQTQLAGVVEFVKNSVQWEDPPVALHQGRLSRPGYDEELDELHLAREEGARWILDFQESEKKKTGSTTLKVRFNQVVGYFIEISKREAGEVPDDYLRKQTLVGSERFTSPRLQELEVKILTAEQEINKREEELLRTGLAKIEEVSGPVRLLTDQIARLDFHCSLGEVARREQWVEPRFHNSDEGQRLDIRAGRHPVVEYFLRRDNTGHATSFIPNSLKLEREQKQLAVITGPNMAGKSTYIRQAALIQILGQMGSFVPAESAVLPVCDRVYTRIGAGDNLTRGQSTFLVEMMETARILHGAGERSLILMDEVGRGTSTYDGLSLAWAIVCYLNGGNERGIRPLTLFATHYHELTELADRPGVFNLTMDIRETQREVVFLRTVSEGVAEKSYGIHVARMAGMPEKVIAQAEEIMEGLETNRRIPGEGESHRPEPATGNGGARAESPPEGAENQLALFVPAAPVAEPSPRLEALAREIRELDISRLSPLDALNFLDGLRKKLADD